MVSLAIENNIEIMIFLFHLQQYLINMFYEILNLRAPNVSNFAEALKVADPSTFKDSWKLADGFVAAEGMFKIDAKFLHHISNVLCMYSNKPYSVASFESKSKQCVRSMIFLKRQEVKG